ERRGVGPGVAAGENRADPEADLRRRAGAGGRRRAAGRPRTRCGQRGGGFVPGGGAGRLPGNRGTAQGPEGRRVTRQREGSMKDRRSLVEGLKTDDSVDKSIEKEFVYGGKAKADQLTLAPPPGTDVSEGKGVNGNPVGRVPLTTRVRSDFAAA